MDINRAAPVVVELETTVDAPLPTVWELHTDIDRWPTWQRDITRAGLTGRLAPGATFTWHTAGLEITSTVTDLVPGSRIAWGGPAHGIDGIHVWTFEETAAGVVVRTAESWDGPPVHADPDAMRAALRASLVSWLAALRETAESRA